MNTYFRYQGVRKVIIGLYAGTIRDQNYFSDHYQKSAFHQTYFALLSLLLGKSFVRKVLHSIKTQVVKFSSDIDALRSVS